jgi:hypothetical protein
MSRSNIEKRIEDFIMKKRFMLSTVAATAVAITGFAQADMTVTLDDFQSSGGSFASMGAVSGSVTSAYGDLTLNYGSNWTWVSDLTLLFVVGSDVVLQIGGYSTWNFGGGNLSKIAWASGDSSSSGATGGGWASPASAVNVDGAMLYMGNGYGGGGASSWSGTIDVYGANFAVPAPGALALLGLAGIASRRRRK